MRQALSASSLAHPPSTLFACAAPDSWVQLCLCNSYKKLAQDVRPGAQILCADGSIVLVSSATGARQRSATDVVSWLIIHHVHSQCVTDRVLRKPSQKLKVHCQPWLSDLDRLSMTGPAQFTPSLISRHLTLAQQIQHCKRCILPRVLVSPDSACQLDLQSGMVAFVNLSTLSLFLYKQACFPHCKAQ